MSISSIGYILAYVALLFICLVSETAYGVYVYQEHYFAHPLNRWWGEQLPHLRYSFITAVIILASYLIRREKYATNKFRDFPQLKWFAAMVLMCCVVAWYALWKKVHIESTISFIKLFCFIFIAYKVVDTPDKCEKMLWVHLAGCFYLGWLAHSSGRTEFGRLEGIGPVDGSDSNDAASVLITAIPLLIFYLFTAVTGCVLSRLFRWGTPSTA